MAGPEFFNPGEGSESYDPAALERFREQMKKNAAGMAALQKSEKKQKQKEDRLAQILLKFIQTNQKSAILGLAALLLKENIPASFILSILILANPEIEEEVKREMAAMNADVLKISAPANAFALQVTSHLGDASLPLQIKVKIDDWARGMFEAASGAPFRMLETGADAAGHIKNPVIDCTAHVLRDFIESHDGPMLDYEQYRGFCRLVMENIFQKLHKQIENQRMIS